MIYAVDAGLPAPASPMVAYPLHVNILPRCTPFAPDSGGYSSSSRLALGHDRRTSLTKLFTCNGYKAMSSV